jgi:hypothetical protein
MVAEGVAQRQTVRRVSGNQTLNRLRPYTLHLPTGYFHRISVAK